MNSFLLKQYNLIYLNVSMRLIRIMVRDYI